MRGVQDDLRRVSQVISTASARTESSSQFAGSTQHTNAGDGEVVDAEVIE